MALDIASILRLPLWSAYTPSRRFHGQDGSGPCAASADKVDFSGPARSRRMTPMWTPSLILATAYCFVRSEKVHRKTSSPSSTPQLLIDPSVRSQLADLGQEIFPRDQHRDGCNVVLALLASGQGHARSIRTPIACPRIRCRIFL